MRNRRRGAVYVAIVAVVFAASVIPAFSQTAAQVSDAGAAKTSSNDEVSLLKRQVAEQQKAIEALQATMKAMKDKIDQGASAAPSASPQAPSLGQVAGLTPMVPVPLAPKTGAASAPPLKPVPHAGAAPATQEQVQGYTQRVDTLEKSVQALNKGVAGLRFSGDFRYRFDGIWRTANSAGGPQQNVRERYRLRFNVDKAINNQFDAHFQLGSGVFNNPLTFDTDFAGANNRGPLFITEYWGSYHNQHVDLRGGKMPEVFADNSRFFFDDDLRLNGFQETAKAPLGRHGRVEFRAGQYVLTNPNVPILPSATACTPAPGATLPANCAYLAAGFTPGRKVRDTNLFDQGIALIGDIKEGWSQQFITNIQLWRNPNGIQLASLASGFPVLVNGYYGVQVSSGPPETGTGTTTPGGSIFTARRFQVGRINYRITHTGWKTSRQNVPVWLDLQASNNFGVGFARSAWMGTISIGEVKKAGDVRFLYQYGVKDANSMIAQVTDDDFGTGTGVNIRTHGVRLDLGINKFLEWDTKVFIQDPMRGSDPARRLFVTIPAGVNTLYRVQSEFNVKF